MNPIKIDVKIFADQEPPQTEALIPVFHRWIQRHSVPDLLIDVADYSHVPEGPGVVLIGHDAQYSFDQRDSEPGLLYSRRRETHESLHGLSDLNQRLRSSIHCALKTCSLLESDEELTPLRFPGSQIEVRINDRLEGEPSNENAAHLRRSLESLAEELYPNEEVRYEASSDPREPLSLRLWVSEGPGTAQLLERLENRAN